MNEEISRPEQKERFLNNPFTLGKLPEKEREQAIENWKTFIQLVAALGSLVFVIVQLSRKNK